MNSNNTPRNRFRFTEYILVLMLILLAWLNTTAMPVVANIQLMGFLVGSVAFMVVGFRLAMAFKNSWGKTTVITGIVMMGIVLILSGWFLYDGYISFENEEVHFANGDIILGGTLFLPGSGCPCPAAVLIHGSGRQTRSEYEFYAQKLAQRGIIALAYDKRGTGASSGDLYSVGYDAYAGDVVAALNFLASRLEVAEIGLMGYSEGELIAPMAYQQAPNKPAFIVIIGGSGLSPADQVNAEIALRLKSQEFQEVDVNRAVDLNEKVLEFQRTGEHRDSLLLEIESARDEPWFSAAEDIPSNGEELGNFDDYSWWRNVMDTSPDSIWYDVDIPTLFVKGGNDSRSSAESAEQKFTSIFSENGNSQVEFYTYPGADHSILEWPLGENIPPPIFSGRYLDDLADWIIANRSNN